MKWIPLVKCLVFFSIQRKRTDWEGGKNWSINIPGNCRQTHTHGIQVDIHNGIDTGPRVKSSSRSRTRRAGRPRICGWYTMNHRAAGAISLASIGSRTAVLGNFFKFLFCYFFFGPVKKKRIAMYMFVPSLLVVFIIYIQVLLMHGL